MQNWADRQRSKNAVCSPTPLLVANKRGWRPARPAARARGKPGRVVDPGAGLSRGRSRGGAWAGPVTRGVGPAQGLDLSLSPPGAAAAAPVVAPHFQKGPSDSSLGQSGADSRSPAQLPLASKQDPSSPELRATFPSPWRRGGWGTVAAAGS